MKVLMINTNYLEDNGISTFIVENSIILSKNKIEVTVIAPNKVNTEIKTRLKKNSIKLISIPYRFTNPFRYFFSLTKIIKTNKYDVVHINGNSGTMIIEMTSSLLAGTKVRIVHSHNTTTNHPIIHKIMTPLLNKMATQRFACNNAAGKWMFGQRSFYIIKNGLNTKKYMYSGISHNKLENRIVIGNVGRFNYQKNQEFLIDLIKRLDNKYSLLLVGSGTNFKNIKSSIKEANLEDRVVLTGSVSNVVDYLNTMDLFLLPSRFEGQPYSMIEAMANGLPLIVSNKISRETNLTGHVKYLSIDNVDYWVDSINNYDFSQSRNNRKLNSTNNIKILKDKGYDLEINGINLLRLYRDFLSIQD